MNWWMVRQHDADHACAFGEMVVASFERSIKCISHPQVRGITLTVQSPTRRSRHQRSSSQSKPHQVALALGPIAFCELRERWSTGVKRALARVSPT